MGILSAYPPGSLPSGYRGSSAPLLPYALRAWYCGNPYNGRCSRYQRLRSAPLRAGRRKPPALPIDTEKRDGNFQQPIQKCLPILQSWFWLVVQQAYSVATEEQGKSYACLLRPSTASQQQGQAFVHADVPQVLGAQSLYSGAGLVERGTRTSGDQCERARIHSVPRAQKGSWPGSTRFSTKKRLTPSPRWLIFSFHSSLVPRSSPRVLGIEQPGEDDRLYAAPHY